MSVTRVLFAAAVAALSATAFTVAGAAERPKAECGWVSEGSRMVFVGTCANENGESSEPTLGQETPPV